MKKILMIFSYPLIMMLLLGTLFKVMHWPFANELLILSMGSCLFIVPLFFISRMREDKKVFSIITHSILMISICITINGALFKIMHWPGANNMLILGILFLIFPGLIFYIIYQIIEKEKHFKDFFIGFFLIIIACIFMIMFALKTSSNIINQFVYIEDNELKANETIQNINTSKYSQIQKNSLLNEAIKTKANIIHENANQLIEYIEVLKTELINNNSSRESEALTNHRKIENIDNLDASSIVIYETNKGKDLYNKIKAFNQEINTNISSDISIYIDEKYNDEEWSREFFKDAIMISALTTLSGLQSQVLVAEYKSLDTLEKTSSK